MAKLFITVHLNVEVDVDDAALDDDSIISAAVSALDDQISDTFIHYSLSRDIQATALRVGDDVYDLDC